MYPAVLMGVEVIANQYILGADIQNMRSEVATGLGKVEKRLERLEDRQDEAERGALKLAHQLMDCSTKKK